MMIKLDKELKIGITLFNERQKLYKINVASVEFFNRGINMKRQLMKEWK